MNGPFKKMWTMERREPREKQRDTIFANEKNLKNQFANMNNKRHLQEIKDQTSFVFHFDMKNHDRSLVAAPTKQLRIDRYYQLKENPYPQRETIFSTPAVLNKVNTYKSLDSKKHYSNIQASTNMNGVLDYNYVNTQTEKGKGKKKFPDAFKNQSSVGNPILVSQEDLQSSMKTTAENDDKQKRSTRAQSTQELPKTTGNMHLGHTENPVREFTTSKSKPITKWADLQATHIFRKKPNAVDLIAKGHAPSKLL